VRGGAQQRSKHWGYSRCILKHHAAVDSRVVPKLGPQQIGIEKRDPGGNGALQDWANQGSAHQSQLLPTVSPPPRHPPARYSSVQLRLMSLALRVTSNFIICGIRHTARRPPPVNPRAFMRGASEMAAAPMWCCFAWCCFACWFACLLARSLACWLAGLLAAGEVEGLLAAKGGCYTGCCLLAGLLLGRWKDLLLLRVAGGRHLARCT
jgi:hypothetical protein